MTTCDGHFSHFLFLQEHRVRLGSSSRLVRPRGLGLPVGVAAIILAILRGVPERSEKRSHKRSLVRYHLEGMCKWRLVVGEGVAGGFSDFRA